MKPGLARAVPMGIGGFTIGVILAYLIRLAQGLEPNAAAPYAFVGPALVLGAFISAGFFVWGMGAFDPRMSVHGEHAIQEHAEEPAEAERRRYFECLHLAGTHLDNSCWCWLSPPLPSYRPGRACKV